MYLVSDPRERRAGGAAREGSGALEVIVGPPRPTTSRAGRAGPRARPRESGTSASPLDPRDGPVTALPMLPRLPRNPEARVPRGTTVYPRGRPTSTGALPDGKYG